MLTHPLTLDVNPGSTFFGVNRRMKAHLSFLLYGSVSCGVNRAETMADFLQQAPHSEHIFSFPHKG